MEHETAFTGHAFVSEAVKPGTNTFVVFNFETIKLGAHM